jgi:hypothetical protein
MATFPDDADGEALAALAAEGIDLSQPLVLDFFVAAPDERSALAIAASVKKAGYRAEIDFDEGESDEDGEIDLEDEEFGPSWTVRSTIEMVPDYKRIIQIQSDLDRVAQPHGGKADGWGAMVE